VLLGVLCITAGALLLSSGGALSWHGLVGPLAIAGACLAWAIDNNLTGRISLGDAGLIALLKGSVAGAVNIGLAMTAGAVWPPPAALAGAGLVGFAGYGLSLVLFVLALRSLGAARTGAYFSVAPFIGAGIAVLALGEPLNVRLGAAGVLMAAGLWLHLTERHDHAHQHPESAHAHRHVHDLHHRHAHTAADPAGEPHTHWHLHPAMRHRHPHYPDAHHRHSH
jgi:drug/metabolite transporter (DMT)-like permease